MHIVFCMAGLYTRFLKAGYTKPKYLLKINNNQTILEKIFLHFYYYNEQFESINLILNWRDKKYHSEVNKIAQKFFPSTKYYSFFTQDTKGQAETAKKSIEYIKKYRTDTYNRKIVFTNIDTILANRNMTHINNILNTYDGVIDIFNSKSFKYSYIKSNHTGIIKDIAEKKVISDKATTGLYCFKDYEVYLEYYNKVVDSIKSEIYISNVYKKMLEDRKIIKEYIIKKANENTIILGTPEEYQSYIQDFSKN
jgi:UDP-N-acetylglucosamine diphosphorylase / glucose-1-phosphate thymidylyltransferase / UDP-N-acetylgalactosamine diphosphorylase / glucosamine-1-phosphate N-acetyltransferase / galactosamine-1-phosphate N-acetyltransferase